MKDITVCARALLVLLLLAIGASALHYTHNAAFFDDYPNEPVWLSPQRIDLLWFVITPLGIAGYAWLCVGWRRLGFGALYLYSALGLAVLGHYWLAPPSAHTAMMNLTIALEAATAAVLGVYLVRRQRQSAVTN